MRLFHHSHFASSELLSASKKRRHLKVSVVIPALNEAATIGNIVDIIRREFLEQAGIVDEILVIDGASEDATAEVARKAGARVYQASEILPEVNVPSGKGTSMWKGVFVAQGDVIVFLDADIRDFQAYFISGICGPLLLDPAVRWVKAYYRRPFTVNDAEVEGFGGRVTELVVRPLLSAWYPELASIRQPLAGECAFMREDLVRMPFTSGYGIDVLLLLQTYRQCGLESLAQVDIEVRRHRNRPLSQLSLMAFAILHVFFDFLSNDKCCMSQCIPSNEMVCIRGDDVQRILVRETKLPAIRDLLSK